MVKLVKSRAEEQFAATQKKDKQAFKGMNKAGPGESKTRGESGGAAPSQRGSRQGSRRESSRQEQKAFAFTPSSPTLVITAAMKP